jgi:hypothetical protein
MLEDIGRKFDGKISQDMKIIKYVLESRKEQD